MSVLSPEMFEYLQKLNPQNKSKFEVLIYPYQIANPASSSVGADSIVRQVASTALDSIVRFHIQGITLSFNEFEFENADVAQYISRLNRGRTGTISFLEDTNSTVRNYIMSWLNLIYFYDTTKQSYVFRDNQNGAKKNMKILLYDGANVPNYVWFTIEGMRPAVASPELSLGQLEEGPYKIDLPIYADRIDFTSPLSIIESSASSGSFSASSIF